MRVPIALLASLAVASCAASPPAAPPPRAYAPLAPPRAEPERARQVRAPDPYPGQPLMQGYFGATRIESFELTGGGALVEEPDIVQTPFLGGGGQWALGGGRVDLGVEAGLAFSFRTDGGAFASGPDGAVVAVDVDLLLVDLYGGLFASTFLGERWRVYGAAGPLMQLASLDTEGEGVDDSGSGFGLGYYLRGGIEFVLASHTMIGLGARWSQSTIDFSDGFGDVGLDLSQLYFSVTTGL